MTSTSTPINQSPKTQKTVLALRKIRLLELHVLTRPPLIAAQTLNARWKKKYADFVSFSSVKEGAIDGVMRSSIGVPGSEHSLLGEQYPPR